MSASSVAGPSTLQRRTSSPPITQSGSDVASSAPLRPRLAATSHSVQPITTRSLGPSSARSTLTRKSLAVEQQHPQHRSRIASTSTLPTSHSLGSFASPPSSSQASADGGSRRGSPAPGSIGHRATNSVPYVTLESSPMPSPSIFGQGKARAGSFLGGLAGHAASGSTTTLVDQPFVDPSGRTMYKAGFQPKGVWRARTSEFIQARMRREEGRRGEERRLERRLEKLIELHFSPSQARPLTSPTPPALPPPRRSSLAFSLDFEALKNPGELWRGFKESTIPSAGGTVGPEAKRASEQAIVKWEEDSAVKRCPICDANFNIANRKHHCRLCGRVVCALPVTPVPLRPTTANPRTETCSLLIVADWRTGRCEEVEEGFVGYLKMDVTQSTKGSEGGADMATPGAKEGEIKVSGVRTCRECWQLVSRKQYMLDVARVPAFSKLYHALRRLQQELEDALPEFRELLLNVQSATLPSLETEKEAALLRRSLLESFAAYDALAKRIRALPCERGSTQERLQQAIGISAATFLQREMAPLQALPKRKKPPNNGSIGGASSIFDDSASAASAADAGIALALQPLLEQEAQLESFIQDAESQRKFDDAKSLKISLEDIKREIERIASGK